MASKKTEWKRGQTPDELFEDVGFRWKVTASGYHGEDMRVIRDAGLDEEPNRVVTDGIGIGQRYNVKVYTPLALPHALARELGKPLYAAFAETAPTEEGILAFANKWGLLGVKVDAMRSLPPGSNEPCGAFVEELRTWRDQIGDMREAVDLLNAIQHKNRSFLGDVLRWNDTGGRDGKGVWAYHRRFRDGFHGQAVDPPLGIPLPSTGIFEPAGFLLQRWINKQLAEHVSPLLLWQTEQRRRVIRIVPKNLLGALWLQLARVVAGKVTYRTCKVCGKWLTISTEESGFRTNREFCSAACRQKDHRHKVREARRLRTEGAHLRDIARQFDTTTEAVKNWLAKDK